MATIKRKVTSASQLFKRLNSYSRQHPLYAALKEFGKIEKSLFLLKWIDLLDLRQAVEKQLNKGENANRFADAICFGRSQEFLHAEKMEQEMADGLQPADPQRHHLLELSVPLPAAGGGAGCGDGDRPSWRR